MNLTVGCRPRTPAGFGKVALIMLVPAFAVAMAPNAAADGDVVVYTITSNGPLSSVTYLDEFNNRQDLTNVPAPCSMTFTRQQFNPVYSVAARSTGTEVSCTITVNGQVIDRDSDNDGTPDVDCHEGYDD